MRQTKSYFRIKCLTMKAHIYLLASLLALASCKNNTKVSEDEKKELADNGSVTVTTTVGPLELPAPFSWKS